MYSGTEGETSVNAYVHVGNSDEVTMTYVPMNTTDEAILLNKPVIVHQGRYRLYQKPDGGLHLVYQRDDKDEPDRMELPAAFLRLAQLAGEDRLSIPQLITEVMKLRNEM